MTAYEKNMFLATMTMARDFITEKISGADNEEIRNSLEETLEHLKETHSGVMAAIMYLSEV